MASVLFLRERARLDDIALRGNWVKAFSNGHGLLNMRTRAASLCAEFAISSSALALPTREAEAAGTRIELSIACKGLPSQAS